MILTDYKHAIGWRANAAPTSPICAAQCLKVLGCFANALTCSADRTATDFGYPRPAASSASSWPTAHIVVFFIEDAASAAYPPNPL